jgi:hypothetical protein
MDELSSITSMNEQDPQISEIIAEKLRQWVDERSGRTTPLDSTPNTDL